MDLIIVAVRRAGIVGDRGLAAATLRYALQAVSAGSPRALEHVHVVVDPAGVYPARLVAGLYLTTEPGLRDSARETAVTLVRRALATSPLLAEWSVDWVDGPFGYELLADVAAYDFADAHGDRTIKI